jgi:hypothetical protein
LQLKPFLKDCKTVNLLPEEANFNSKNILTLQ